jgi:flagellar motor switch/type III secretory pathway protein FliN
LLLARFEGAALASVMHHRTLGPLAALLDTPFALTLAARALGADDESARRAAATGTLTPAHEGALAMLCTQAAALACAPSPPPVLRAVTAHVADVMEALGSDALLLWPWRVTVGLEAGEVALVLDARALARAPERGDGNGPLLEELQVEVALVAARASLAVAEVAALAVGDVLVLGGGLAIDVDSGGLSGEMMLVAGGIEVPVTAVAGALTVRAPAHRRRTSVMSDEGERTPDAGPEAALRTELLEALTVEVEVVIARGPFGVGELGAWRVGEVVTLPSRVGDPVLVRAGGRPVARGELCEVEGEVGVRLTELL